MIVQTTAETGARVQPAIPPVDEPAAAASEEEDALIENTVIVRGQRVERTEFETATSVAVFQESDLDSIPSVQNIDDLLKRLPNITDQGASSSGLSVRGVISTGAAAGVDAFTSGSSARVVNVVDGYQVSFNEFLYGATSIYDIEQIEVFRGPQTTAQGANAIGGAIFVFTNDPTFEFEAGGRAEVGNFETYQAAGFVSGPLIDGELAGRIAVDYRRNESFTDFPNDLPLNRDADLYEGYAVRAKLLWMPSALPDFEAKLTYTDSYADRPVSENVTPQSFSSGELLKPETDFAGNVRGGGSRAGIVDLSYEISDSLTVTNQTSYADFRHRHYDGFVAPELNFLQASVDGTRWVTESLLIYAPPKGRFSGIAGVYYSDKQQDDLLNFRGAQTFDDESTSLGLFTQGTLSLTNRLDVTAGVRYQRDEQVRTGDFFGVEIDADLEFDAFLPKAEISYSVSENT
ncbi:MAG: TonB-dependent receptor, partial [Pseudomonadota bacterium]